MGKSVKTIAPKPNGSLSPPESERAVTVPDFRSAKQQGRRLTMLTAYDYTLARLLDAAGVDALLVGDSLGMVVQGQPNCLSVTLDEVLYHTKLVARGVRRSLVIADMPFMSYQVSVEQAVTNAGRLIKEGQAHAVKIEGGARFADVIAAITRAGIPVMAHVGLTPQAMHQLGGFRVQRDEGQLLADARTVADAGAFAVVVECIPADLARKLSAGVSIPTIGIGAGAGCDGQVLVTHDMLGLYSDLRPKFVKVYAELGTDVMRAVQEYCQEVRTGHFPAAEHEFR